jgi:predicted nicotinamide N-methyase
VDEFMPYWAELWPSGLALAGALPARLDNLDVVELGCGLGIPSLVAAARGACVTSVDWAPEAIDLLRENAARNGIELRPVHADWSRVEGSFDLVLAADLLYEERNGEALLELLPSLAPRVLLADPGRPGARGFLEEALRDWELAERGERVYELTRATRADPQAPADG